MNTLAQLIQEYLEAKDKSESGLARVARVNELLLRLITNVEKKPFIHGKKLIHVLTRSIRYIAYIKMQEDVAELRELLADYDRVSNWSRGQENLQVIKDLHQKWSLKVKLPLLLSPFAYAAHFEEATYASIPSARRDEATTEITIEVARIIALETTHSLLSDDMDKNLEYVETLNDVLLRALLE
ncbi:MAG: hypothetical protein HZA80_00265 [Candidatus Taylorbacteria bacterium]|nr:hypothetical protein [Candidatus Taylorbacteria bacterium]